ncbi:MAG TPA: glycoside hydrolase family 57 protein [Candidatus Polarisedimenticolia bacterium]|nr:glycoside hydrolase family 57 protein [Candidatus Polarisedimenticolia bacterium]
MSPLNVAILWHQHQPLYRSFRSGRYALPWVRLHGLKDYYDMASLAGEHPRMKLTFNLVPSLLDQLDDYVRGTAVDPALALARAPAAGLNDDERLAMLDLFFSVPYRTLIAPYPRYAALFHKRGGRGPDGTYREALNAFRPADVRDLQVWFHLAWSGGTLRRRPEVKELIHKGDSFTEEEKNRLLDVQDAFLREIVPIHRRLQAEGIAEIATSPYYHPILPLLCDAASAREAVPHLPLPAAPFRRPADARWQIRRGLASMERRFGRSPAGMWPSEGSLSEEAVRIMGEAGVRWTASDEGILKHAVEWGGGSFHRELTYRLWRLEPAGETSPVLFFRDQELSDLVGFTYATWPAADAAADLLRRLRGIAQRAPGGVACVILDGENAWEHYPHNAEDFLRALYAGLTSASDLRPVTFSQAAEAMEVGLLRRLRAGSWIGSSFTTWIGHPEKNRAWELLAAARQAVERRLGPGPGPGAEDPVWQAVGAAEGSDWFWWYGDDHSSEQDAIFDAAFRDLVRGIYEALGEPPPAELDQPIKQPRGRAWSEPSGKVSPTLDGAVTDYFEWLMAGQCDDAAGQGTMHQASGLIRRVAYGTDGRALYVRVDPGQGEIEALLRSLESGRIVVEMTAPAPRRAAFAIAGGKVQVERTEGTAAPRFAAGRVLEVEIPLGADDPQTAAFYVVLTERGRPVQRLPRDGHIEVSCREAADWRV